MDMNDLEEDCCAAPMPENFHKFGPSDGRLDKLKSEERFDSDAGLGASITSHDSGCLTDIRDQILKHSQRREPTVEESVEDFEKLAIDTKDNDEGICDSVQEGDLRVEESSEKFTDDDFLIYGRDADGDTLLHLAIISGHVMLAKVFIEVAPWTECLDIYNDKLRQTPLHLAVLMKQVEIVRLLLDNGANPEMFDHNGDTALHIACRSGNVTMVKEILKHRESRTVQNLDVRNYEGYTCLHVAVVGGFTKIVDILLKSGADVNVGDGKSGATALHLAAKGNKIDIVSSLLEQPKIAIDNKMYNGVTPLMVAVERQRSDISDLLVSHNADIDFLESLTSSEEEEET
ncbi:NF-kappa-B inhibitor alpha-like [Saccostrea echinata]|uniref:NF-kappa-B inhibitor alpha-like n=1 Tax=Saccostrea echinata TaxID=191078 RepID=UPI002A8070EB|nr:NF-kappa-B inhibitor alpha-like [Saccostrea echinata]